MGRETKGCEVIVALDLETDDEALAALERIGAGLGWVKIGLQLFTRYGPPIVEAVAGRGYKVFLDLKLHDIPNTVAKAVQGVGLLPVDLLTLHAAGGAEMIAWAREARDRHAPELRLLGVTVLTSMDAAALRTTGVTDPPEVQVSRLARLATGAGLDGLVCSPLELPRLREEFGDRPLMVTPGIRPTGTASDEQKRVMTPAEAARAGADFIVVGRPVLRAADPAAAVASIRAEIEAASATG